MLSFVSRAEQYLNDIRGTVSAARQNIRVYVRLNNLLFVLPIDVILNRRSYGIFSSKFYDAQPSSSDPFNLYASRNNIRGWTDNAKEGKKRWITSEIRNVSCV